MTALSDFKFGFISPGCCIYLALYECHTSEPACHENKILLDFLLSAFSMNSIKTMEFWAGAEAPQAPDGTCRIFTIVLFLCHFLCEPKRVNLSTARN